MSIRKSAFAVAIAIISFLIYALLALTVDNQITLDDEQAIQTLGVDDKCVNSIGPYEAEVQCLISIQTAVQAIGEKTYCPVWNKSDLNEPSEFLRRNHGCCVDRSRFIEKAARYYGYETRHIALIQPKYSYSLTNLLPLNQSSHATSEILTVNGWLGVDSNEPFVLIGADNSPDTYRDAINNLEKFPKMAPQEFYQERTDVIYGLYSRHGNFHGMNFPGPEFVFSELKWNWQ